MQPSRGGGTPSRHPPAPAFLAVFQGKVVEISRRGARPNAWIQEGIKGRGQWGLGCISLVWGKVLDLPRMRSIDRGPGFPRSCGSPLLVQSRIFSNTETSKGVRSQYIRPTPSRCFD